MEPVPLPRARGPLSAWLVEHLSGPLGTTSTEDAPTCEIRRRAAAVTDSVRDADLQLSLWLCYQLHVGGVEGVDDAHEWSPQVVAVRTMLEARFEEDLRRLADARLRAAGVDSVAATTDPVGTVRRLVDAVSRPSGQGGRSLSRHLRSTATAQEARDFLVHRSIYHLQESDPHNFVLAKVAGAPKVALAELQYDEFGAGDPARLHQSLFRDTMRACGLPHRPGQLVDAVDATTLASVNALWFFALNRRWRGAALGHLAASEATSSLPCRDVASGLRRLGFGDTAARYYDEHVEADAVHEQVALDDICGGAVAADPTIAGDVVTGAAVCLVLDEIVAEHLMDRWSAGEHLSLHAAHAVSR